MKPENEFIGELKELQLPKEIQDKIIRLFDNIIIDKLIYYRNQIIRFEYDTINRNDYNTIVKNYKARVEELKKSCDFWKALHFEK